MAVIAIKVHMLIVVLVRAATIRTNGIIGGSLLIQHLVDNSFFSRKPAKHGKV